MTIPASRRSTTNQLSRSAELEVRVAHAEHQLNDLRAALELQSKRTIALQAQLDHLVARSSNR